MWTETGTPRWDAAYGIPTFRPASWPLGCLPGKAEEVVTVFSPWEGGKVQEGKGSYVRVLFMYADVACNSACGSMRDGS